MIVLSLFDGMSCGRVALERAGVPVTKYYASEIDKYAIQISKKNYPDIIHLGDINNWNNHYSNEYSWNLEKPDLIIAGSPCQGFSFAGKQLAFDDPRSALFWKYVEILNYYKPKYFLLENVRMKKEYLQVITDTLRVVPICINSNLVSAQNRVRYYWTNIPNVTQPVDKGITIEMMFGEQWRSSSIVGRRLDAKGIRKDGDRNLKPIQTLEVYLGDKLHSLTTVQKDVILASLWYGRYELGGLKRKFPKDDPYRNRNHWEGHNYLDYVRYLTPIECERLQTLPDNYTEGVSNTQRYKMIGNGWTVDVLAHIFKNCK